MGDVMNFPKTINKFIEQYSFKDSHEIYTNGCYLIPVFRVEQAIEHYGHESICKAIDDFAEAVKIAVTEMDDISTYDNPTKRICEILMIEAERLKAGDAE